MCKWRSCHAATESGGKYVESLRLQGTNSVQLLRAHQASCLVLYTASVVGDWDSSTG